MHKVTLKINDHSQSAYSSWPESQLGSKVPPLLIILCHGFPDCADTWLQVWPHLQKHFPEALILAPWMRGYEPSTVFPDSEYTQTKIAGDIIEMAKLSNGAPVHLVGHDWGAVASYRAAVMAPDLFASVTTMSIPLCMVAKLFSTLLRVPSQAWYSSYMLTLNLPFVYRPRIKQPGIPYIKGLWEYWSPDFKFTEKEFDVVCSVLHQPGVMDAATAYYRCMFRRPPMPGTYKVDFKKVPFSIIHGRRDGCVNVKLAEIDQETLGDIVKIIDHVGHFMTREDPERVSTEIVKHIKANL